MLGNSCYRNLCTFDISVNRVVANTIVYNCRDGIALARHARYIAPEYVVVSFVGEVGHDRVGPNRIPGPCERLAPEKI